MGPFPYDDQAKRFIVMIMDVYFRYIMAIPVQNHTAQTVSNCLYEHVVAYFGVPRLVLSDRGTKFTSSIWESLTQFLGIKIRMASPYYPQGYAVIERSHRTLNSMLRTMSLEKKGKGWRTLLPSIMLYMNSMIQEQSGVSAWEILFGENPTLPSDLSFAPAVSVMEDREGYVKQLKRELGDIRAKLSRILGQEKNQEKNPFSVGEHVIITILPRENRNKLLTKWKGPFTITKVPNRFQIEYLENGITRTTHISYAKKFLERSLNVRTEKLHNRLSRKRDVVKMAHLRLVTGSRRNRRRMRAFLLAEIYRRWHYLSGPKIVRVQVHGAVEELREGLRTIVVEAGTTQEISRERLLDLCGQRSYVEGVRCDGSSIQAVCEDLTLSQEDGSPTVDEQVGKESDSYNWNITREIPDQFKSVVGYQANHSRLNSFQTSSGSSPKLAALVRTIQERKWPTSKYQPPYVFKPNESIPAKKVACRPRESKLAYVGNSEDQDRKGFGIKVDTGTKDLFRKTHYAFWNTYMCLIICIIGKLRYVRNLVNTWQPYELPTLANRIPELDEKAKITPETCRRDRKRCDKSYKNFWNIYCDVPWTSEEPPEPSSSSPTANHRPAVQVNQFSWRNNAKTDKLSRDKRREFVNSGKYSNHATSFPTQQAPLVSQEHLQAVVRKVARGDRFKGKNQQHNGQELMTSSSHSRQKAKGAIWRDSCYNSRREVVTDKSSSMYQYKSSRYSLKPSGDRKELKESQFEQAARSQPPHIRDVMDDAIKSGEGSRMNVNKPVARERHNISEHLSSLVREDHNSAITMNTYFLICLAFIFLRVINIIKSGFGINSLRHKWVVGLSTLVYWNEERLGTADPPPDNFGGKRSWGLYTLIHKRFRLKE